MINIRGCFLLLCFSFGMATRAQDKSRPEYRQAVETARMTAQRNLAETVLGVLIQSGTEVKDFVTQKDVVIAKVSGQMRGVVFSRPVYDKTNQLVKVAARISRDDVITAMKASGFVGAEKLNSQPAFFDATGEAVYEESSTSLQTQTENPVQDPQNSSALSNPSSVVKSLPFSISYEQLAFVLFEKVGVPFPVSDADLIFSTLQNRAKVYFGLSGEEGVQLELRLKQSDIQLVLQVFVLDFEASDKAMRLAKTLFHEGIVFGSVLRGKEIFPLSTPILNWYTAPLSLHYPLARTLLSGQQAPEEALLAILQKEADFQFTYFRGSHELQIRFDLDLNSFTNTLKQVQLSTPLNGLNALDISTISSLSFLGTFSGEPLLPNLSWTVLGTPIDCPKATGSDFSREGFLTARQNAKKLAEQMVLQYLENHFGLSLNALPMISPLFQGISENKVVLQLNYSTALLTGYLKQKYSEEELQHFFKTAGDGLMVWVTFPL